MDELDTTGFSLITRLNNSDLVGEEDGGVTIVAAGVESPATKRSRDRRTALEARYEIGQLIERHQEDYEADPALTREERELQKMIGPKRLWGKEFSAGAETNTAPSIDLVPVLALLGLIALAVVMTMYFLGN